MKRKSEYILVFTYISTYKTVCVLVTPNCVKNCCPFQSILQTCNDIVRHLAQHICRSFGLVRAHAASNYCQNPDDTEKKKKNCLIPMQSSSLVHTAVTAEKTTHTEYLVFFRKFITFAFFCY